MTSFVHVTFPQQHPGVDRAERAMVGRQAKALEVELFRLQKGGI